LNTCLLELRCPDQDIELFLFLMFFRVYAYRPRANWGVATENLKAKTNRPARERAKESSIEIAVSFLKGSNKKCMQNG
jgi:hypothetical protein